MERRNFNQSERIALYLASDGKCSRCGIELGRGWHADHEIPWSKGGPTDVINGQALCETCNLKKGSTLSLDQPAFDGFRGQAFERPLDFVERKWQLANLLEFRKWIKERILDPIDPQCFLTVAGVGSGKTSAAAMMAADLLNSGEVQRIVYVSPNVRINEGVKKAFADWGIDLEIWSNRKHSTGEGSLAHGAIITYQSVARQPGLQRALLRKRGIRTAVFFDEIHHLGEEQSWGDQTTEAFGPAHILVGLSGTPFRTDNRKIPFVKWDELPGGLLKYRANYTFTLGEAVAEGLCRKPAFRWLDGEIVIDRASSGKQETRRFSDPGKISEDTANYMLSGAVAPDSECRYHNLARVISECREKRRKLIIFVGGDSRADDSACDDAAEELPKQLASLGITPSEILSVTHKTKHASHKIANFDKSDAWILIAVQMVSEGVNIPSLSSALFLTKITSKQTTIQRIGRVLRMRSIDDPIADATIYMFRDFRYVEYSLEIENEINREFEIKTKRESPTGTPDQTSPSRRTTAIGVGEGGFAGVTSNGCYYTQQQYESAVQWCADRRPYPYPKSMVYIGLALEELYGRRSGEVA
jgi:superfamily II DNA or RNA helicase